MQIKSVFITGKCLKVSHLERVRTHISQMANILKLGNMIKRYVNSFNFDIARWPSL